MYLPWIHFAETQQVQTKVFSFIYLHKFKVICRASSKFWPSQKKCPKTLERAHIDRRLTQTSRCWGRHLRTKGLGKSGGVCWYFKRSQYLAYWRGNGEESTTIFASWQCKWKD
jgi:hypothetical protein